MRVGILGAGIAGLSSAHFLKDHFPDLEVYEAAGFTGGLARSFKWHGFDCNLGTHVLLTTDEEILGDLTAMAPMDRHRRKGQIFIRDKWIADPVNAVEIVIKFFPRESFRIVWHYLFKKKQPETNFEAIVLNQFGIGLNEFFFKPYSEKLFGIPASEISPAWARKKLRVGGLKSLLLRKSKVYARYFYYPKAGGYGAIADSLYTSVKDRIHLNTRLVDMERTASGGYRCTFVREEETFTKEFDTVITSLPLSFTAGLLGGSGLEFRFRPTTLFYLLVDKPQVTNNHWFYFADADYVLNRVAEFKNFEDEGLPKDKTVICCEITNTDQFTPERALDELEKAGVLKREEVLDTKTINLKRVYPIYELDYDEKKERARTFFAEHPNLHLIGRQAQFVHNDVDEIYDTAKQFAKRFIAETKAEPEAAV